MPSLTGKDWAGIGVGAAGGILPLLFGGSDNLDDPINALKSSATSALKSGKDLGAAGADLFAPVSQYLKDVTGGDRQALLSATMPERRRVIDQYATAKKNLAEFTPRGGGQAGAMTALEGQKASDLATTTSEARQKGVNTEAQLATQLSSLGLSAQSLASGDLNAIIAAISHQNDQKAQSGGFLGEALGTIAGFLLG